MNFFRKDLNYKFETNSIDGPNSDELKAMHYELENLSKLGKVSPKHKGANNPSLSLGKKK